MIRRALWIVLVALLGLALLCAAATLCAYLAGCACYLLHRTVPRHVSPYTWYRFWLAWSNDPAERRRLITAALIGASPVLIAPLWLLIESSRRPSTLHGDARWANRTEIRRAGLL